jgi:cobalt-precorrin 5A hydrolase
VVEKHKLRGPDGKNATVSIARMAAASSTPFSPPSVS